MSPLPGFNDTDVEHHLARVAQLAQTLSDRTGTGQDTSETVEAIARELLFGQFMLGFLDQVPVPVGAYQ
jgi:hypothetical protein